ncbi:MAG: tripartite tricarboxylate transporter substrate binding protein, partial [Burkholderiales bacterium]|nr:tripartite tricarboxylate transporter substrate binding protein [Burkholderiales bacterium]
MMLRTLTALTLACLQALLQASPAIGQTFPSRPVFLVAPTPPGAAYDLTARVVADGMRDGLGSIVVENRPGGNFVIGADYVRRSQPDGHTLLLSGNVHILGEALNLTRSYDFFKDFDPVGHVADLPFYLVVQTETVPVKSLRELISFVKARPGKLIYISGGNGSLHHFAMEALKHEQGLDILHVPYKAMSSGGVADMISGRVNMLITGYPAVAPHMKTGKLRVLATVNPRRTVFLPEVPTFAEAGAPGIELVSWFGVSVAARTPPALIT